MKGVRRLLGAATSSSHPPPSDPQTPPQQHTLPQFSPSPPSNHNWPPSVGGQLSFETSPQSNFDSPLGKNPIQQPHNGDSNTLAMSWGSNNSYNRTPSPHSSQNHNGTGFGPLASPMTSPDRVPIRNGQMLSRSSTNASSSQWDTKHASGLLNTRDELLISLMASEAVLDSRNCQVLNTDDVEDLKKEYTILSSRVEALSRKLALETKMRDAAQSLAKVNAAHKQVSKQTEQHLESAQARVETAQRELWRISARASDVQRRLLEHRTAVLALSVRTMEKKMSPSIGSEDSGYDSSNRSTLMSPATAISSFSSASKRSRFDGAHLFAGHADAVVPKRKTSPDTASKEISTLEEKLKVATAQLAESSKIQAEMKKELSVLQLEKQEVETMMAINLQAAEDTIGELRREVPRLKDLDLEVQTLKREKADWEKERENLAAEDKEADALRERVRDVESRAEEASGGSARIIEDLREAHRRELEERDARLQALKAELSEEREGWNEERMAAEDEKHEELARLHEEMGRLRQADEKVLEMANAELNGTLNSLRSILERFKISTPPRNSSTTPMQNLIGAVTSYLEDANIKIDQLEKANASRQRVIETEAASARERQDVLLQELEETKRERDNIKRETMASARSVSVAGSVDNSRSPPLPTAPLVTPETSEYGPEVEGAKFLAALQPLWEIMPSPAARATKLVGSANSRYRVGTPTAATPPASPAKAGTSANGNATVSLSDLDVRSLKALYDPRNRAIIAQSNGPLTLEGFIARVHALIADDRALIERLIRFAQAHDLLKKNAERAQKLAQDGNTALETYQRQVKHLEARNANLLERLGVMQAEFQYLNTTIEQVTAEKRQVEARAAEQAEEVAQLNEANNNLSARTLTLAEEAASAPEGIRKQLEECKRQLQDCQRRLEETTVLLEKKSKECESVKEEVEAMAVAEQGQKIALLDELNTVQTENTQLRTQLRAAKAGGR